MSGQRQGSEGSLISYRSQLSSSEEGPESSPGSPQSPERQDRDEYQDAQTSQETPPTPRVHFKSNAESNAELSRRRPTEESLHTEAETSKRNEQPHRPSAPFEHGSTDIADTPLSQRSTAEEHPSQESVAQKAEEGIEDAERSLKDRVRDMFTSFKQKTAHAMTQLGRDEEGGDDLHPSMYHTDWMHDEMSLSGARKEPKEEKKHGPANSEAHRLVRAMNEDQSGHRRRSRGKPYGYQGFDTKQASLGADEGLRFRTGSDSGAGGGVLSQLMRLQNPRQQSPERASNEVSTPGTPSGAATPRKERPKWYRRPTSSPTSQSAGISGTSTPVGNESLSAASKRRSKQPDRKPRLEDEIRVTIHIAEIIARQRYIMQLCKALMRFGAPTHRLEEYMQMTAQVLEVESQYLYLPGCMIMAFDDPTTRTTEVKLVRVSQGIDLNRLANTHNVYKNVVHDIFGVEEATQELEEIMRRKPRFNKWFVVVVYGLATATVGPFAFDARPIDMPIIFLNGCLLALMQHVLAPRSVLYSNVFEVTGSVLTSFLARAFGSIPGKVVNGHQQFLFCFSAISQSSIALILPGFLVLCSSLELQSHQIAAGSIRMVYAIIYSLFLGYGITVGTTIYGLIHKNATSETQCSSVGAFPNPYVQRFPFVAIMVVWLVIVNQGRFKQIPPMLVIAIAGYVTNYFCTETLGSNSQVANTVGAFTIGVFGNLYSRIWHGHAATAILPGIFVLVPSGLAATGSLVSGLHSADQIRSNVSTASGGRSSGGGGQQDSSVTNLGFGMIQVAIGITIGLFLAALVIYPYGKRRSGLFSF